MVVLTARWPPVLSCTVQLHPILVNTPTLPPAGITLDIFKESWRRTLQDRLQLAGRHTCKQTIRCCTIRVTKCAYLLCVRYIQQNDMNMIIVSLTEWSWAVGSSPNDLLTFTIYTPTLLTSHSALHSSVYTHAHVHTQSYIPLNEN